MTTSPALRASIYLRISETDDTQGVDRQLKECRELLDRNGWEFDPGRVFVDNDISASRYSRKPRPGYNGLLESIRGGQTEALVTWHTDRMHRRPAELEAFIDLVGVDQRNRIEIAACKVGRVDLTTASGRMMARGLGNYAAFESELKSERLQSKHRQIAEDGGWHGGIRPFGYDKGGMTIREDEAAEIRRLAHAVICGQSLRSLAMELNERGVPTVKGGVWGSAHLRSMLVRPRLVGLRQHGTDPKTKRPRIIGEAKWPAILDKETHDAVKTVLENPARFTGGGGRRGPVPTTLGTGIYVCGVCGEPKLRLGSSRARRAAYKCGNVDTSQAQGHVTRVADKLDAYVEGALLEIISRPGAVEAMCAVVDTDDAALAALRSEQVKIRRRLNTLAARMADPNDDAFDDEQTAITSKMLRDRNNEITAILTAANMRSPLDVLLGAESVEQMWDEVLTLGQKRAILAEVLIVTVLPTTAGGRAPDGSYFNADAVRVALTDRARSRLGDQAA
jgi:DNA invertase Pin-like site-specific DNA recombinase